jgi:hypothetical protein
MHMHECMYVEESSGLYCTDVIRYAIRERGAWQRDHGDFVHVASSSPVV